MTSQQYKVCKIIRKYKNLNTILKKADISDYLELQNVIPTPWLDFSDSNMDDDTYISLTTIATEEFEQYHHKHIDRWITRIVAIWGGVTGTVAIAIELMRLFQ